MIEIIEKITIHLYSFILGVTASLVGTLIYQKYIESKKNRPLRELLNFGNDDPIIFVFPPRSSEKWKTILPWLSAEDSLAINNISRLLAKLEIKNEIRFSYSDKLNETDKRMNVISICASRRNSFTESILNMENRIRPHFFNFSGKDKDYLIKNKYMQFISNSYTQIEKYDSNGTPVSAQVITDVAIISKFRNPLNAANKVLVLAGIRGIGTWGAAEMFRKNWQRIYKEKGEKKDGDFSAVVSVKYINGQIVETGLLELLDSEEE